MNDILTNALEKMLNIIREIQIKPTIRYYFSSTGISKVKKRWIIANAGEDVKKLKPSYIVDGTVR